MALTGWSTSNRLERTAAVYETLPLIISAWGFDAQTASHRTLASIGSSGTFSHRRNLRWHSTFVTQALEEDVDTIQHALTTVTHPANTWTHSLASFVSLSDRSAYISGGNQVQNTSTSSALNAGNRTVIGAHASGAEAFSATGGIAEVSIWNSASFTETGRDNLASKLAAGENPLNITAESGQEWTGRLIAYWPLTDTSDINDVSGNGHHMTMVGTLTNHASHPTIDSLSASRSPPVGAATLAGTAGLMGLGMRPPGAVRLI